MNIVVGIISSVVFSILSMLFLGIWVYKDAKQRGLNAWLWALVSVMVGNLVGLILYLLIGRKSSTIEGEFKSYKGYIIATIISIILSIVTIITPIIVVTTSDGFMFERMYGGYSYNSNGFAKMITDKSGGDTWEISFNEASGGYYLDKIYTAKSNVNSVLVDIKTQGSVMLVISQNHLYINETLENGQYTFDLSQFDTGKIYFKVINIDAKSLEAEFIVS